MEKNKNNLWSNPWKIFIKYVIPSVLGMIGISAYILADTFFISVAGGADGIATLNLVLPVYGLIFAIGSMIGVGSATRFSIYSSMKDERADVFFMNSILWALLISVPCMIVGIICPGKLLELMGGNADIVRMGIPYLRIVLLFTPFFMLNYIINAFTRNDGAPNIAMGATVFSSLFNIVFDYIFMFPLNMGMAGAALATAVSPIVGSSICMIHVLSEKSTLRFQRQRPSIRLLLSSCQLGIAAFIGEMSSGITTLVFNLLILGLTGNNGVAAYGVIANISLIVIAVFNGIAQGGQPVWSNYYGKGEKKHQHQVLKYALILSMILAGIIALLAHWIPEEIVSVFNSENNAVLQEHAVNGIKIYFTGMLFASVNIVVTGYLGAIGHSLSSSLLSVLRGVVIIVVFAFLLAKMAGMFGIWMTFPATEFCVMIITIIILIKERKSKET